MGGRAARHRMREEGPVGERRPIRASMPSGNYRPLAESDLARIHVASLDILERIGIADATPAWRDRVVAAGGSVSFVAAAAGSCVALAQEGALL